MACHWEPGREEDATTALVALSAFDALHLLLPNAGHLLLEQWHTKGVSSRGEREQ